MGGGRELSTAGLVPGRGPRLHNGHSDQIAIRDGTVWVLTGRQHLSAVVVRGVSKHVLESVRLGQQQPDLFVAPVYCR